MDVACFCGCRFPCAEDLGACPGCGEYVSLRRDSDTEEKQMRAELDLLLTMVPLHVSVESGLLGARDMEMSSPTSGEPELLAVAPRRQNRGTCDERDRPACRARLPAGGTAPARRTAEAGRAMTGWVRHR